MPAFLLVHLRSGNSSIYEYPIITWIKEQYPEITVLDVDNSSDDLLISYACRLIVEEDRVIIYFIAKNPDAPVGAALRIIEAIISTEKATIQVLSEGQHNRLAAILTSRPHIPFLTAEAINQLKIEINTFYNT